MKKEGTRSCIDIYGRVNPKTRPDQTLESGKKIHRDVTGSTGHAHTHTDREQHLRHLGLTLGLNPSKSG